MRIIFLFLLLFPRLAFGLMLDISDQDIAQIANRRDILTAHLDKMASDPRNADQASDIMMLRRMTDSYCNNVLEGIRSSNPYVPKKRVLTRLNDAEGRVFGQFANDEFFCSLLQTSKKLVLIVGCGHANHSFDYWVSQYESHDHPGCYTVSSQIEKEPDIGVGRSEVTTLLGLPRGLFDLVVIESKHSCSPRNSGLLDASQRVLAYNGKLFIDRFNELYSISISNYLDFNEIESIPSYIAPDNSLDFTLLMNIQTYQQGGKRALSEYVKAKYIYDKYDHAIRALGLNSRLYMYGGRYVPNPFNSCGRPHYVIVARRESARSSPPQFIDTAPSTSTSADDEA